MIKTVFLDIDDTIYSYKIGNALAMKALYDYCCSNFGMSEEEARGKIKAAHKKELEHLGAVTAATHNRLIRFQLFAEMNNIPIIPHAENMNALYWNTLIGSAEAEPGLISFLSALQEKGITIAIGTNMTADMQFVKLRKTGVGQFVRFMVSSEELCCEKPDQAFFDLCLEKADVSPSEIAFIGDGLKNDAQGAEKAGMHGIWYAAGKNEDEIAAAEGISAVIRHFDEALAVIDSL